MSTLNLFKYGTLAAIDKLNIQLFLSRHIDTLDKKWLEKLALRLNLKKKQQKNSQNDRPDNWDQLYLTPENDQDDLAWIRLVFVDVTMEMYGYIRHSIIPLSISIVPANQINNINTNMQQTRVMDQSELTGMEVTS